MKPVPPGAARITPSLCYDDPAAAIDWICRVLGFEVQIKVQTPDGSIPYCELVYGEGVINVSGTDPTSEIDFRRVRRSPRSVGGANTHGIGIHIDDIAAHHAHAVAAGAKIIRAPETDDYGPDFWADRAYCIEDPEGHFWWFIQRLRGASVKT